MQRSAALQSLPEAKLTEGVSIDDYADMAGRASCGANELG